MITNKAIYITNKNYIKYSNKYANMMCKNSPKKVEFNFTIMLQLSIKLNYGSRILWKLLHF